jgi:gluconolactonase
MARSDGRAVTVLAGGLGFTEGPVVVGADVVVTSVDRGRVYRVDPSGGVTELTRVEGGVNGLTVGPGDVLYGAHLWGAHPAPGGPPSTGGVVAWDRAGGLRWVTRDPISPNDLCFGPDGLLYLTDPTRPFRRGSNDARLWRVDVADPGPPELLRSVDWFANGIGFGPADGELYVAATDRAQILRLPVTDSGLGPAEIAVQLDRGVPDGFAFDVDGNLVIACVSQDPGVPGSVQTWSPDGVLLDVYEPSTSGKITNCALTEDGTLYVTDAEAGAVLRVSGWPATGLPLHPFRTSPSRRGPR